MELIAGLEAPSEFPKGGSFHTLCTMGERLLYHPQCVLYGIGMDPLLVMKVSRKEAKWNHLEEHLQGSWGWQKNQEVLGRVGSLCCSGEGGSFENPRSAPWQCSLGGVRQSVVSTIEELSRGKI